MTRAFQVHPADNVATLLDDARPGPVTVSGGGDSLVIEVTRPVALAHKIALREIPEGGPVIKYGVQIGIATRRIRPGEWVHLHNCRSAQDERSSTLDVESGATTDTPYE
jgi:hypothetical protein